MKKKLFKKNTPAEMELSADEKILIQEVEKYEAAQGPKNKWHGKYDRRKTPREGDAQNE